MNSFRAGMGWAALVWRLDALLVVPLGFRFVVAPEPADFLVERDAVVAFGAASSAGSGAASWSASLASR